MSIIAIIVGGMLGAMAGRGFGLFAGALLGWLLARSWTQARQISELQEALELLRMRAGGGAMQARPPAGESLTPAAAASDVPPPMAPHDSAPAMSPDPVQARSALGAEAAPSFEAADGATAAPAFIDTLPGGAPAARRPAPPRLDPLAPVRRWLFGGNTIVKAGVSILFIGLAFLAKYAGEHVQVPVEMRLAGIVGVALALLIVGWRLRLQRPGYAQVLQGGAVAVLYLILFVAFRFYGVLAVGPVFGLMVLVAALAAALAVLQDARSLAVMGALGGFAAPLLVSTGSGDHVALFSYYLVLDLGITAVAWHKTWRALNLVGFIGTYLVGTGWGVLEYHPGHYASSQAFLLLYFLLFIAILLMPARHGRAVEAEGAGSFARRADGWVNGSLLFGLPTISFALQYGLVRHTEYGTALSALVLAGVYVLLAMWLRSRPRMALVFEASLAIGTVFLTLVIPFALDARSTAGAWALEGAGLVWLGLRQSRGIARAFGYAMLLLAGLSMLHAHERFGAPASVFDAYLFNALMAAAASLAAAYFVQRHADKTSAACGEALAEPLLIAWATLWLAATAGSHIDRFVQPRYELAAWLAFASSLALLCTGLSVRLRWRAIAFPALAHAPVMALGVLAGMVALASPLQGGGWWAWPLALATHSVVLWRAAPRWPAPAGTAVHALGALVLAALGALQGRAVTADWGDAASAWAWLGWLAVPAALLLWLPRPATAQRWPVSASPAAYRSLAAAVLAAGLLLWTLLANVASDGSARPLPHVPLLNPLDVGIGIALLAAALWMQGEGARAARERHPQGPVALLAAVGFVWLNAMLIRAFHHYGGVPYRVAAWADSLPVQTGITLLWTVTALVLMWLSARRVARLPWMTGAALLAAVVLKLLLVDLSGSGTVTRIVSFIGVGLLMLVIGYVAPLPSKEERHATT